MKIYKRKDQPEGISAPMDFWKSMNCVSLDELEEVTVTPVAEEPPEQAPWEPKGGDWVVQGDMTVSRHPNAYGYVEVGSKYPTRDQAEAAAKWDLFYRRLLALACELNPSGVPVAKFEPLWNDHADHWETNETSEFSLAATTVFETRDATTEACRIMNRDGWRLPV